MKIGAGIVSIMGVMLLISSAFAGIDAPFLGTGEGETEDSITLSIDFSEPKITYEKGYARITYTDDDMSYLSDEGAPLMPYKTEVLTFPLGTKITDVVVELKGQYTLTLSQKVAPAPAPLPANMQHVHREIWEGGVYQSTGRYPGEWATHTISIGREGDRQVVILSIQMYPVQYAPQENMLHCIGGATIRVSYEVNPSPLPATDAYDLVIIAPEKFSGALAPLITHKESYGIATKLVTLEEIYSGTYFSVQGRDDAEKVKYFIKDAIEEWGIEYVMLVGGRHGGIMEEKWWCPVRYSYLDDGSDEDHFLCDLYFSDIYKYEEGQPVFDDWDSNGNGVFGEWGWRGKDVIDMYPDVYVGRLPCRNTYEVGVMVEKIITYETTASGQSWSKKFVGVGGDTYPDQGDLSYYEGERATEAAFNYLDGFQAEFLWTSTGALTSADDIIQAINEGCGFLHFSGHGNPMSWANHPPEDGDTWIGIDETQFVKLKNKGMYPVCIVGGCHNNQFNISLLNLLDIKNIKTTYYKSTWGPECWGWWLTRKTDGGTIATIANTGYGYGTPGAECLESKGRYMELQFFRSYSEGKDMLGETHASGLTYFLNKFPPLTNQVDSKIVEQWVLFGDPSLKIGGY